MPNRADDDRETVGRAIDDRRIVRLLRAAGRAEPNADDHAAAVARVRASLQTDEHVPPPSGPNEGRAARPPRRWGWRLRRRPWLTASVAASAAVAAAVFLVVLAARPQTAWARLEAAVVASGQFRGWVSLYGGDGARPFTVLHTERSSRAILEPPRDGRPARTTFYDHRLGLQSHWTAADNTVYLNDLMPEEVDWTYDRNFRRTAMAVDFAPMLNTLREQFGAGNVDLRQTREEGLDRYDVTLFVTDDAGHRKASSLGVDSYWVDPQTGLISRMWRAWPDGRKDAFRYRYNDPVVGDVYDLGVPRDAKVVDRRPIGPLKDRLDAMDRRLAAGTGDGVAVVCTVIRDPGIFVTDATTGAFRAEEPYDKLAVYAQSGRRWAWREYRVGPELPATAGRRNADRPPVIARPPGWPDVDPAAAVAWVKDAPPADRYAHDGQHVWRGVGPFPPAYEPDPAGAGDMAALAYPGRLWPGRHGLATYDPWSVGTLRSNPDGTETIAYVDGPPRGQPPTTSRELKLDGRTGLPIKFVSRSYTAQNALWRTVRTTFASTLRTPTGVDLPERWTSEDVRTPPGAMTVRTESRLRFDPAAKVPEAWFGPPAPKGR